MCCVSCFSFLLICFPFLRVTVEWVSKTIMFLLNVLVCFVELESFFKETKPVFFFVGFYEGDPGGTRPMMWRFT